MGELLRRGMTLCVVALFIVSFAGVAISGEEAGKLTTIKGEISSIDAETGQVMVKDDYGKETSLKAGPDIDLKSMSEGDRVSVESSSEGAITSITKEE